MVHMGKCRHSSRLLFRGGYPTNTSKAIVRKTPTNQDVAELVLESGQDRFDRFLVVINIMHFIEH